jgi:peptidoglycan/xylan/chitin deacetylase (PgdA/CDA1 family)
MRRHTPRDRVVHAAKWLVANLLYWTGGLALRRRHLRGKVIVLAYHRLLPHGADTWSHPGIVVSPETFEQQLHLLRRYFQPLSLAAFEDFLYGRVEFSRLACLVTFDDGWIDTCTEAWPALRRVGLPAAVFLATSQVGSDTTFWQERLGALLGYASKLAQDDAAFTQSLSATLASCGLQSVTDSVLRADKDGIISGLRAMKSHDAFDPARAIEIVSALLPGQPSLGLDRFMTWHQARGMLEGGLITFGAHGHLHAIMTDLSPQELARDLETSKETLAREIERPVKSMSYPNGNWKAEVVDQVRRAGFATAFTMERGFASAGDDPHCVRRVNIHEENTRSSAMFLAHVLGVF